MEIDEELKQMKRKGKGGAEQAKEGGYRKVVGRGGNGAKAREGGDSSGKVDRDRVRGPQSPILSHLPPQSIIY